MVGVNILLITSWAYSLKKEKTNIVSYLKKSFTIFSWIKLLYRHKTTTITGIIGTTDRNKIEKLLHVYVQRWNHHFENNLTLVSQ